MYTGEITLKTGMPINTRTTYWSKEISYMSTNVENTTNLLHNYPTSFCILNLYKLHNMIQEDILRYRTSYMNIDQMPK